MEKILFLSPVEADGSLGKAGREALGAAKKLAGELGCGFGVGLYGETVQSAADAVAGCGAEGFFGVSGAGFGQPRYATDCAAIVALTKAAGATVVVAPATARVSRAIAGAAQRLGGAVDTNLTGLDAENGAPVAERWFYRQRMRGTLTRTGRPWLLTVSSGCFEAVDAAGSASVQAVAADAGAVRTEVTGLKAPAADQQTIRPDAELLFVTGAGWMKKQADGATHVAEAGEIILGFLGATKASLGSSKSLVDFEGADVLPFLTHLHQVGQTGATPRHPKGLATCCHGEEPHVVGWRFIGERRAVNLDAGCGWAHGKADVLYVADAFAVMKKVNELLG
ncbi:MAG: electron transfer flavoprotein subunit alpha/FixB family protein [Desulfovibrionaceae bacterium]